MADPVHLHGYRYSVYTRIVRLVLLAKTIEHETVEVNPFAGLSDDYLMLNPFGRVPLLTHGAFTLFETGAIVRYVDRAFEGPRLQPDSAAALARMDQLIGVIDAYAYWPMVRQVASHGFFRPFFGEQSSVQEIDKGLEASRKALSVLEGIAGEGEVLTGRELTLADCHLAPMIDYFVRAEEGRAALCSYPALESWWDWVSGLDMVEATDPFAVQVASG
jgi:glutathione S-transferase